MHLKHVKIKLVRMYADRSSVFWVCRFHVCLLYMFYIYIEDSVFQILEFNIFTFLFESGVPLLLLALSVRDLW